MPSKNYMDHAIASRGAQPFRIVNDTYPSEYRYWMNSLHSCVQPYWLRDDGYTFGVILHNVRNVLYHCGLRNVDALGVGHVTPYPGDGDAPAQ